MNLKATRLGPEDLAGLASRLTSRDFAVIDCLVRHKIATTSMLAAIFFTGRRRAALRLQTLYDLGLLERTRVPGSGAYRWTATWGGQALHALRDGQRPPSRAAATWTVQQAFLSPHRTHKEGVNAFVASLHLAARATGEVAVTEWLNEAEAAAEIIGARPDTATALTWADGRSLRLWYEHDRGTETVTRLAETIERYRTGRLNGPLGDRVLLFGLPSAARLDHLANAHADTGDLLVAATVTQGLPEATALGKPDAALINDARWRVLGAERMVSLADLAH